MSDNSRSKFSIDLSPAPVAGAMSASAFAAQQHHFLFQYDYQKVRKEEFFEADDDGATNLTDDDLERITQLTISKETSAAQYRDEFYSTLVKNETFSNLVKILPKAQDSKEKYTEASMSSLFVDMYNETISVFNKTEPLSERTFKKQRVEHALLIANTSQPDLVVVQRNGLNTIRIGEFKQHNKYSMVDATNQCFSYLRCMLYFYRAVCNIPLVSVYGFAFCGDQCKDLNKQYAIGLFQLSAPNMIGGTFIAKKYWQTFSNGSNEGIKLLLHYLTQGKSWELPTISPICNTNVRLPALFNTPNSYWYDIESPDLNAGVLRVLQRNGTSANVFRVNFAGLLDLFNDMMTEGNLQSNKDFAVFVNSVTSLGRHALYYVKIRVADTSPNFVTIKLNTSKMYGKAIASGGQTQQEINTGIWKDILDLYVVPPYNDDTFHCIVMADAGRSLISYARKNCFGESTMIRLLIGMQSYMYRMIEKNTLMMYGKAIASGGQTQQENNIWKDFLDLYVVPPYIDKTFHCIVMADAGRSLKSNGTAIYFGESTMIRLLIGLQSYMYRMIEADIFHGDFLPHNFVYSETADRIKVIDFDEGSFTPGDSVPLRVDQNEAKEDSFVFALRYPNLLRHNCELYTKVQFAASVLVLLDSLNGNELVKNRNLLQNVAKKLGIELAESKEDENDYRAENLEMGTNNVCSLIDSVYNCMDKLLNANYDAAEVGCDE